MLEAFSIKDNQQNLIAEIIYKDGLLYCNSPDSDSNCDHVKFATSLIELANTCKKNRLE